MAIRVIVRERIYLSPRTLPEGLQGALCDRFRHENPKYHKLARMGFRPPATEPPTYFTWKLERDANGEEVLSFPRGGMRIVREELAKANVAYGIEDRRIAVERLTKREIPDHLVQLRPYQEESIQAAIQRQNCILRAPTGCIAEGSLIGVNRAAKGSRMRIEHVVEMFNGGTASGKTWDPEIETRVRAPFKDGTVRLAKLLGAKESGMQSVYRLRLEGGLSVVATPDHRLMTPFGWVQLELLGIGDFVLVDSGLARGRGQKPWYKLRTLREHPYAGRRGVNPKKGGWTVPEHRLVAEARLNNSELEKFISDVKRGAYVKFLDPEEWVVHHKDENPRNNAPDNLEVMTHAEHRERHIEISKWNVTARLEPRRVLGVKYEGVQPTYDLEVEEAGAFIADEVAVHNSGKTTAAIGLLSRLKTSTLVQVWSGSLMEQWVERLQSELGIKKRDIGIIRAGRVDLKPVTVGMQQTIASMLKNLEGDELEQVLNYFGAVICDEVQRFAAPTLFASVDPFPAKYRIGISADESRKDKKEFLTYDLFGEVAHEVKRDTLIDSGDILDVEVCVIPTELRCDWYKRTPDWNRLLEAMQMSVSRNKLATDIALEEIRLGEQVLIISHRVDHCYAFDQALALAGVKSGVLIGGAENAANFEESKRALIAGKYRAAVGTLQAIGQGLDIPSMSRLVCTTPVAKNRQQENQMKGRICRTSTRTGKKEGRYYYLWDQHIYGTEPVQNLIRWNRNVKVRMEDGTWLEAREYLTRVKKIRNLDGLLMKKDGTNA